MEGEVHQHRAPPGQQELPQGGRLWLAEGPLAAVLLTAGLPAAAPASPLVAEVPVEVHPSTPSSLGVGSVLKIQNILHKLGNTLTNCETVQNE